MTLTPQRASSPGAAGKPPLSGSWHPAVASAALVALAVGLGCDADPDAESAAVTSSTSGPPLTTGADVTTNGGPSSGPSGAGETASESSTSSASSTNATSGSSGGASSSDSSGNTPSSTSAANSGSGGANSGSEADSGSDGSSGAGAPGTDGATTGGESGVIGIIAVGYGGLRIVSRDLGETWSDETHWSADGGDDHDLLRTIAYGNGQWLSGGWRMASSLDGVEWTDLGDSVDVIDAVNCPVTDGMAFGAGVFLVACGSNLAASADGQNWEHVSETPEVGGHPYLVFDETTEQFACSGDDGASFVSSDGRSWTEISLASVHLCEGLAPESECPSFYYEGVFLSTEWGGWIRRSTDGSEWSTRYSDSFGNNLFTKYSFAVGRVAP